MAPLLPAGNHGRGDLSRQQADHPGLRRRSGAGRPGLPARQRRGMAVRADGAVLAPHVPPRPGGRVLPAADRPGGRGDRPLPGRTDRPRHLAPPPGLGHAQRLRHGRIPRRGHRRPLRASRHVAGQRRRRDLSGAGELSASWTRDRPQHCRSGCCAAQSGALLTRSLVQSGRWQDREERGPVSAAHHCVLRRARDDKEAIQARRSVFRVSPSVTNHLSCAAIRRRTSATCSSES